MPMSWAPFGWRPFSMLLDMTLAATVAAVPVGTTLNYTLTLYASGEIVRTAVFPFITLPTDTLANQQFTGKLKKALEFHVSIYDGGDIGRRMASGVGELQIEAADRGFDSLYANNTIDGRRVHLQYGQITLPDLPASFDTYQSLLDGIAQDWFLDGAELRITLRDNAFKLDGPASLNTYGGTGGADGTADMAGKRKPGAFGALTPTSGSGGNVTPAYVNPTLLVYQVHDGSVQGIPAVYDSGVALSGPDADYANYAALIAASINNGHYATSKAAGMFALGSPAFGELTCDVQGDNGGTGGYVTDSAAIWRRVIVRSAPLIDLVDEGSFTALSAAQPAVVGYYLGLDDSKSVRQVGEDLLGGIGACGGLLRDGVLNAVRFVAPTGSPVDSYTENDIVDDTLKRLELPSAYNPPPKRQRVTHSRNWTVQTNGLDPARAPTLKDPYKVATHSNTTLAATIAAAHLLAQDPEPMSGYFRDAVDAVAEADRQLTLKGGAKRAIYVFTVKSKGLTRKIGDVISLTFAPGGVTWFDLSAKLLTIIARNDNTTEGTVEITAFG